MSKEKVRPSQFGRVVILDQEFLELADEQIQELEALYDSTTAQLAPGQLIQGKIISVEPTEGVLVDVSYKSHGFIPKYEFTEHELKSFKVGDLIDIFLDELENTEGNIVLSYEKAKSQKAWDRITKLFETEQPVEGMVTHTVKGGLSVDIGIPAFLPGSQVDLQRVTDFEQFVNKPVTGYILKINKKRGNVILSRRKYLSEQRSEVRQLVLDKLIEGNVIQGVVKNITNYGVFIDVGGVDGLLHITDMTWGRISHPSEIVKINEKVTVKVLSIDKENNKISLGMKQLSDNPWQTLDKTIINTSKIKGKISSITDYGLFIEVARGVEGLVHISEISWTDRVNDLEKHYKVGQEIESVVVSLDRDNRRMSLSIKQLDQDPWKSVSEKYKVSERIKGKITNITDFGIFIQLLPGVDGLAHVSDLSWTEHIEHPGDIYKKEQEVEAIILSIDAENKKVSLGIKQLTQDPWELIESQYPIGTVVDGEVTKITNFGAFVKLPTGIEGLVHVSRAEQDGKKLEDILKVGEKSQFKVVSQSKEDRKLGLSYDLSDEAVVKEAKPKAKREAPKKVKEEAPKAKSLLQLELEKLKQQK